MNEPPLTNHKYSPSPFAKGEIYTSIGKGSQKEHFRKHFRRSDL